MADGVARAAAASPVAWHRVVGGGYTAAGRWLVDFDDGRRAFAKIGVTELVAGWLRTEYRAYTEIGIPVIPRLIGWADGPTPVLLLEDLSEARWPPPWDATLVARSLAMLDVVAEATCPTWAPRVGEMADLFSGWSTIVADRQPFLGLGLVSGQWLETSLPTLVANERPAELAGSGLVHFDVRSDNMCFTTDRALLVDWNQVARGNPLLDVAAWLPSLANEGGPSPEEVRPEAGVFAAALAGIFCSHAPRPIIPDAPNVRDAQRVQGLTALRWAARWLGLPGLDGPNA